MTGPICRLDRVRVEAPGLWVDRRGRGRAGANIIWYFTVTHQQMILPGKRRLWGTLTGPGVIFKQRGESGIRGMSRARRLLGTIRDGRELGAIASTKRRPLLKFISRRYMQRRNPNPLAVRHPIGNISGGCQWLAVTTTRRRSLRRDCKLRVRMPWIWMAGVVRNLRIWKRWRRW